MTPKLFILEEVVVMVVGSCRRRSTRKPCRGKFFGRVGVGVGGWFKKEYQLRSPAPSSLAGEPCWLGKTSPLMTTNTC